MSDVSPITTPIPWSINKFLPILALGWISIPVKNLENWEIILAIRSNFAVAKKFAILWKNTALTPGYVNITLNLDLAAGSLSIIDCK